MAQATILGHSTDRLVSPISAAAALVAVTMAYRVSADGAFVDGAFVDGALADGVLAEVVVSRVSLGQAVVVVAVYARGP